MKTINTFNKKKRCSCQMKLWLWRVHSTSETPYVLLEQACLPSFIYPLTAGIVGAPQMTSQPVFSVFPHCPQGLGELQACPFFDVVFPPVLLSALFSSHFTLCLERWFWPYLMNGRHDHTTSVCTSLPWSGCLLVVRFPAGSLQYGGRRCRTSKIGQRR